jgi:uncharacterized protein (UPF0332 family)
MNEIASLIERARRYLKSARTLLGEPDHESCVSRVYYAMFYTAQAMLLTQQRSFSSHKGVIAAFGEHFIKTGVFEREMDRELNRAFEKRQLGDYEYAFSITRTEAEQSLASGEQFVERVSRRLTDMGYSLAADAR